MKKLSILNFQFSILLAVWIFSLPVLAQNTDAKFVSQLGVHIKNSGDFLNANKLSSKQMRKMMVDTFRDKAEDADFFKALDKYFPRQYENDLAVILKDYYAKNLTLQQIDTLINSSSSENIKRSLQGLEQCQDAAYRDKLVDETLQAIADKTGKKKKKKNLKKFVSDCPEDYRSVLANYAQVANIDKLAEDEINAIYHTIALEDLNAYTSFLGSNAVASSNKAEAAVTEDIYNVQSACISKFQSWTYKAYPSLFTKKQVQPKKRKGRKGKGAKQQNNDDVIIDGGALLN
jgi:hypothetical protein